jgi:hypothetical protein
MLDLVANKILENWGVVAGKGSENYYIILLSNDMRLVFVRKIS